MQFQIWAGFWIRDAKRCLRASQCAFVVVSFFESAVNVMILSILAGNDIDHVAMAGWPRLRIAQNERCFHRQLDALNSSKLWGNVCYYHVDCCQFEIWCWEVFGFDFVVMAISDCAVFLTVHEIDFEIFKMWLECSTYHVDACGWSRVCWNDVCFWFGLGGMICSSSHLDAFLTIYEDDFENFKLLPEWPTYHVDACGWSRMCWNDVCFWFGLVGMIWKT